MPKAYVDPILVKAIHFAREHLGPDATVTRMQIMTMQRATHRIDCDTDEDCSCVPEERPVVGVHWDVGIGGKDRHAWSILGSGPSFRAAVSAAVKRSKR